MERGHIEGKGLTFPYTGTNEESNIVKLLVNNKHDTVFVILCLLPISERKFCLLKHLSTLLHATGEKSKIYGVCSH